MVVGNGGGGGGVAASGGWVPRACCGGGWRIISRDGQHHKAREHPRSLFILLYVYMLPQLFQIWKFFNGEE
jgi:hypothetical protein